MQKMNEDEIFEMTQLFFKDQEKEILLECLSALLAKIFSNGVSIGDWQLAPDYIEYSENEIIKREYAQYVKSPIRDTLRLDFAEHDKKVIEEFKRNF